MQKVAKKNAFNTLLALAFFAFLLLCLFCIERVTAGMQKALSLCGRVLVPTLFPFLVLSDLLLSCRPSRSLLSRLSTPFARLMGLSREGATAFLLGNLFGFPTGVRTAVRYYREGSMTKDETERLFLCCNNASPFFLVGSVGTGMLGSRNLGVFLYLLQFIISFLVGSFFSRGKKTTLLMEKPSNELPFSFTASVQNATTQTVYLCAYVLFFSVVGSVMLPLITNDFLTALCWGILEIGSASAFASKAFSTYTALPLCAFCSCFSGLSVYFQAKDCLGDADLSMRAYLPVKLLCGVLAFTLCVIFLRFH